MAPRGSEEKVFSYGILVMTLTHVFIHIFDGMLPSLLPLFKEEFGLTLSQLGIIASMPFLGQAILSIPSGYISDRLGAKTMIASAFTISITSALVVSAAPNILVLIIALSTLGLVSTLYHPASFAYTSRIVSKHNQSKSLGLNNAGGTLGFALGPLSLPIIIGVLALGWRTAYLAWILPCILALITVLRLKPEKETSQEGDQDTLAQPVPNNLRTMFGAGLVFFLVFTAVRAMGIEMIITFLPTYLSEVRMLRVADASLMYGSVSLLSVIGSPLGGLLSDRFKPKTWLAASSALATALLMVAYLAPSAPLFIGFYFAQSFMVSLGIAANSAMIASLTPTARRGMGYALYFLPISLIGAATPAFGGIVAERMGLATLFPLAAMFSIISLLILHFCVKA